MGRGRHCWYLVSDLVFFRPLPLPGCAANNLTFLLSDNHQRLCFSLGLWNGKDPILKERLYGLNGSQGEWSLSRVSMIYPRSVYSWNNQVIMEKTSRRCTTTSTLRLPTRT